MTFYGIIIIYTSLFLSYVAEICFRTCHISIFKFVNAFLHALLYHTVFTFFKCDLFFNRRRFLYVVNLETPSEAPRKISRQSKWDVGTVQWNPHKTEAHLFAASVREVVIISIAD